MFMHNVLKNVITDTGTSLDFRYRSSLFVLFLSLCKYVDKKVVLLQQLWANL